MSRTTLHLNNTALYGAASSRAIDAYAIEHLGVSGYALMQRAADAAFSSLLRNFPNARSISVVCGKGNNAGDAYLLARCAQKIGMQVQVLAVVEPVALNGDAARAHADAVAAGVVVDSWPPRLLSGDVIIDGLLGTGLSGPPRPVFAAAIDAINTTSAPVLSIDIPSGVSADTGAVFEMLGKEMAVNADVTVSFITRKIGLYTGPGVANAGRLEFADLGVPSQVYTAPGVPLLRWDAGRLASLEPNTYKHRRGHVVVAGGDTSMPGAVAMACEAALRVGAGMVTALTRSQHVTAIVTRMPEVMVMGFEPDAEPEEVAALLQRADVVVCGPGLGRKAWGKALFECVEKSGLPTVLDADGLYWLAQNRTHARPWQGGPLTITPHLAEAARLLACDTQSISQDRLSAAAQLHSKFDCLGVLKGAGSIVFSGDHVEICAHGNPGMATAGMGDVLSGILGGFMGQALDARLPALRNAVSLHSAAADEAVQRTGVRSLLATDVTAAVPHLLS